MATPPTLTADQIYAIARQVGFNAQEAYVMTAIALRESNGHAGAHNGNRSTGDDSYGLWQINMLGSMGPSRLKAFGISSYTDLFDPLTNAKAAYQLYKAGGYKPWSTDPNHMDQGRVPISADKIAAARAAAQRYTGGDGWAPGRTGDLGGHVTGGGGYDPGAFAPGMYGPDGSVIGMGSGLSPTATDAEVRDWVRGHYGYAAGWLDVPEVGPLLMQAAREGWDSARLQGELSKTAWWKATSDSARTWQNLTVTDPASAEQQRTQRSTDISTQAQELGLTLTADRLKAITEDSLRFGWSAQQLKNALVAESSYSPGQASSGQLGANTSTVKALAANYMLPMSEETAFSYAQAMAEGTLTTDGLASTFAMMAKGKFPSLAKIIDSGVTPAAYFSPYRETISQLLEIPAASIDLLNDPKWSAVVNYAPPGTTDMSQARPMTLSEVQNYARSKQEWLSTNNAKTAASDLAEYVARTFGKVA